MDAGCVTEGGLSAALDGAEVVYNLGTDELEIDPGAFVIYQGSHGDRGAHRADEPRQRAGRRAGHRQDPHHRQDAGLYRVGEVGPSVDKGLQVGGARSAFLQRVLRICCAWIRIGLFLGVLMLLVGT